MSYSKNTRTYTIIREIIVPGKPSKNVLQFYFYLNNNKNKNKHFLFISENVIK